MTVEQLVRDQLERATREVAGGPDLDAAISSGRRRRRTLRVALASVAVAGAVVIPIAVTSLQSGHQEHPHARQAPVADHRSAAPTQPGDFVPGTEVDANLAAVVAAHLPSLPAPDDVYPSDSHTAGPMADADFAAAKDWQATYALRDDHRFLLMTALASEGPFDCPRCDQEAAPGGTIFRQVSQPLESGTWQFATWFVRDDGSVVGAFEYVPGGADQPAPHDRVLADADLEALVQDPALTFAALGAGG